MIRIPLRTYLDALTFDESSETRVNSKKEARKKIESLTGYPYPLISLSVSQGKFSIEG